MTTDNRDRSSERTLRSEYVTMQYYWKYYKMEKKCFTKQLELNTGIKSIFLPELVK